MTRHKPKTPASAAAQITTDAPIVTVSPTLEPLLARVKKDEKVSKKDLARVFEAIRIHYLALGEVPAVFRLPEILDAVSRVLVRPSELAAIREAERAEMRRLRDERLRREAEKYRQRNPNLPDKTIAKKIIVDPTMRSILRIDWKEDADNEIMSVRTIRGIIARRKK